MDVDTVAVIGRSTERIIIILFCGMSLWCGWRLFYRANDEANQTANISWKSFAIGLKKVGPGVFFALFGSAVLATALRSPLQTNSSPNHKSVRLLGDTDATSELVALNTAYRLAAFPVKDTISELDREAFHARKDAFDAMRLALVRSMVGEDEFYEWKTYRDRLADDLESVPKEKRASVTKVQDLLDRWK